jgi:hypothetical protein
LPAKFIPFGDIIAATSRKKLFSALQEVSYVTIFASVPIWIIPFCSIVFLSQLVFPNDEIQSGEFFIYSEAVVGPLLYVLLKAYGEKDEQEENGKHRIVRFAPTFPHQHEFVILSIITCAIDILGFVLIKYSLLSANSSTIILSHEKISFISWVMFFFTPLLLYFVTVSRNLLKVT